MTLVELTRAYCSLHALEPISEKGYLDAARIMGNPEINDITFAMLQTERARSKSPYSWNATLGKLRATIRFAIQCGWATHEHPVFKVKRLHAEYVVREEITDNERQILREIIQDSNRYKPDWFWLTLLDVLYYTGIRRRQLCHLRWGDLDLGAQTILLRAAGSKNKRERLLPLHPKLTPTLIVYRKNLQTLYAETPIDSSTQLFNLNAARGLEANKHVEFGVDGVTRFFNKLSKDSGLHITAHLLRHSFATKISREIPNIKMVQLLLNHDRTETTLRYIHPTLEDMHAVMSIPLTKVGF